MSSSAATFRLGLTLPLLLLGLGACSAIVPAGPGTPPTASEPAAAWSVQGLDGVADYARSQKTTGLLIIQDGRTVLERNWPLGDGDARFAANWTAGSDRHGGLQEDVASLQKSFLALLAAVAIDRGVLDIERPASAYLGSGWSGASPEQERAITVRHLLEMSSGLGEKLDFVAPAGAVFFYNTPAYAMLKPVLERASGQSLERLSRAWLTEPLGMVDTLWRQRPAGFGSVGNPTGLYSTPRDMARLGRLFLDKGLAPDGRRVVSEAQLAALAARTPRNPSYGRLWWLNGSAWSMRADGRRVDAPLIPAAPDDLVMAFGALDRRIFVSPGRRLIVVRTGQAAPDRDFNQQLWLRLMKAMPAG